MVALPIDRPRRLLPRGISAVVGRTPAADDAAPAWPGCPAWTRGTIDRASSSRGGGGCAARIERYLGADVTGGWSDQ